jgi:hypothetical protein
LSWTVLANALITWLLFDVKGAIQPASLLFVLYAQLIRRSSYESTFGSFSELTLELYHLDCRAARQRDDIFMPYSVSQDPQFNVPEFAICYKPDLKEIFSRTSIRIIDRSEQPLAFSLCSTLLCSGLLPWCPDWTKRATRLLLDHPASDFSTSRSIGEETELDGNVERLRSQPREWICHGFTIDVTTVQICVKNTALLRCKLPGISHPINTACGV